MAKHGSFIDGYLDGWRSVFGQGAALPGIPSYAIPVGKTEYEHGYDEGRAAANATNKPHDENSD
jgi:hypothetical protein